MTTTKVNDKELEQSFLEGAEYLRKCNLDVTQDQQLAFYGLFKQATAGPCTTPKPGYFKLEARAKWDAWKKYESLSSDQAAREYIVGIEKIAPNWNSGATVVDSPKPKRSSGGLTLGTATPKGFDLSTVESQEKKGGDNDDDDDEVLVDVNGDTEAFVKHGLAHWASQGDLASVEYLLSSGEGDFTELLEGLTPLMWAADRGHLHIVRALLRAGADPNVTDDEDQTALHFAAVCDHAEIVTLLMKYGADATMEDISGQTPADLCEDEATKKALRTKPISDAEKAADRKRSSTAATTDATTSTPSAPRAATSAAAAAAAAPAPAPAPAASGGGACGGMSTGGPKTISLTAEDIAKNQPWSWSLSHVVGVAVVGALVAVASRRVFAAPKP
eukprot:Rmarinus@m.22213